MGRSAALTEPAAFAMPAPHTAAVQMHCESWMSLAFWGMWHVGSVGSSGIEVGKGRAPSFRRSSIWWVVRFAFRDSISAVMPEAAALARLEARQLAFIENLTRYADRRAALAGNALRQLGLDPGSMVAAARTAQGGPFERVSTSRDGSLDPRFERMALSLARMSTLEDGLNGVPQFMPADMRMISSGFGYRSDPFNGHAAMHAGLDFRGPVGAPIHAAAKGRVTFVGTKTGYGKVVEISHGNGMMTRYAHMSAWRARVGQAVAAGDVIGQIGNTGRSTGPHLHFEVRIHDRAVNPRPFLESAPHVLEEARADLPQRAVAQSGQVRG